MKFRGLQHLFLDKHISTALRFKLFDAVVTSTAVYSLDTSSLTVSLCSQLDIVQSTMLRRMVGWMCYGGDSWEERGRRMKRRLEVALTRFPLERRVISCKEREEIVAG